MKTLVTLLFILGAFVCNAQQTIKKTKGLDDVYYVPKSKSLKEMSELADKDQVSRIVYCLDKYKKERSLGMGIGFIGILGASISPVIDNIDTRKTVAYASTGALLISAIIFIDAEKWLSGDRLLINGNGISIRINK